MAAGGLSIHFSRRVAIRAARGSAFTSSTASSPTVLGAGWIWTPSQDAARAFRWCCRARRRWSRPQKRPQWPDKRSVGFGQPAQRGGEDLAGFADQRRAAHVGRGIGEGTGDADADRVGSAKQRGNIGARCVAPDQNLALEGIFLHGVTADIEEKYVTAKDLAVAKQDDAAALAGATVLKDDVDRIKPILHGLLAPVPNCAGSLCQSAASAVNAAGWPLTRPVCSSLCVFLVTFE